MVGSGLQDETGHPLRGCDLVKGVPAGKCTRGEQVYERVCVRSMFMSTGKSAWKSMDESAQCGHVYR